MGKDKKAAVTHPCKTTPAGARVCSVTTKQALSCGFSTLGKTGTLESKGPRFEPGSPTHCLHESNLCVFTFKMGLITSTFLEL